MALSVMYSCCAGLDVHKETVVSCILLTAPSGKVSKEIRTFGTTTSDLQMLSTWLSKLGVTHVAMESTGSIGDRCLTCWRTSLRSFWSTLNI